MYQLRKPQIQAQSPQSSSSSTTIKSQAQQAKATTTTTITTTSSFACELSSMHSNQIGQKQDLFTISIEKALPYVGAQVSSIQNQTTTNLYIIKALVHKQEKTNEETGD